ncbi:MAG TPA: hypothetical protein VHL11_10045, partial [Phototrophicaceae bacterium]|nr:hypothetical protein [Phototrophicaceae bacterium]
MRFSLLRLVIAAGFALLLIASQSVQAASFDVGCSTTELVAAINTANGDSDPDTLNLAANCVYSFTTGDIDNNDSALPRITTSITINGNHAIIERASDAAGNFRLIYIASGTNVALKTLTIRGGMSAVDGGGILNVGNLTVINSAIIGNHSPFNGGGIYNQINATMINTIVSGNHAGSHGGGVYNGIGSLSVINSTIAGNNNIDSGGLYNEGGNLTIFNSILWGNSTQITSNGGSVNTAYSVIEGGGYDGTGNLDVDPLFIDAIPYASAPTTGGDY